MPVGDAQRSRIWTAVSCRIVKGIAGTHTLLPISARPLVSLRYFFELPLRTNRVRHTAVASRNCEADGQSFEIPLPAPG